MGCDIHRYVEYKNKFGRWESTDIRGLGHQNYEFFGFLEDGIRSDHNHELYYIHEPIGFPADAAFYTIEDYFKKIEDEYAAKGCENYITSEKGKEYSEKWPYLIKIFSSEEPDKLTRIQNPNWYGATWISLEEFKQIIDSYKKYLVNEYPGEITEVNVDNYTLYIDAIYNFMKTYEDKGLETRLVYWFDG